VTYHKIRGGNTITKKTIDKFVVMPSIEQFLPHDAL